MHFPALGGQAVVGTMASSRHPWGVAFVWAQRGVQAWLGGTRRSHGGREGHREGLWAAGPWGHLLIGGKKSAGYARAMMCWQGRRGFLALALSVHWAESMREH